MSLYGSRNINSGTIEIANPQPMLSLTKQYDMLQYTSTSNQAMHFALGRWTLPMLTLCNQNVGINTLVPSSDFHVTGTSRFVYTHSNQIWLQNPSGSNATLQEPIELYFDRTYSSNTAYSWLGHRAGTQCNYFYVRTHVGACNNTDQLVVLPNGNVGVGTVAPIANLHVAGTIKTDAGRIWMSPDAILDSASGNFEVRKTSVTNSNAWDPMIHYHATSPTTPCNLWIRGTLSVNSSNYAPARVTLDGPRLYIRNSNQAGGEARLWLNNNAAAPNNTQWLIGQSNQNAHDLRITRSNQATGEQHVLSITPTGDTIIGSNQLAPLGRLHVVTNNLANAYIYDATVSNLNMPALQIASNNGPEGAIAFASPTYALYRRGTDLRLRNNDYDRLTIQTTSLATYNGPFRLFGCNVESNVGELQFGDAAHALYRTTDDSLRIRTSNTSRLTVKYNGLVGISNDTPQELLDVYGSVTYGKGPSDQLSYIRAFTSDHDNDKILFTRSNRAGSKLAHGQQSNHSLDLYAGYQQSNLGLFTLSTGTSAANAGGWARRMVVSNSNGNTTIGSNLNPPVKLLVEGEHWADFIKGSNVGTPSSPTYAWTNDPDTGLYNQAPNAIGFATGGQNVMTLSNDRLGIGLNNTTPKAQLHVANDMQLSHSQTKTYIKTLGKNMHDVSHVCSISSLPNLGHSGTVHLSISHSTTTMANSKKYVFAIRKNATSNKWRMLIPISTTSIDYLKDIALDIQTKDSNTVLRLRRPSHTTSSTHNITVMFTVHYPSDDVITCADDSYMGQAIYKQGFADWAVSIDSSSSYEEGNALKVDSHGNVYTAIIYTSDILVYSTDGSYMNAPTTSGFSAFIVKYSPDGLVEMGFKISGVDEPGVYNGIGLCIDGSGNIYVAGDYTPAPSFYDSNGVVNSLNVNSQTTRSVYIAKYDKYGRGVWVASMIGVAGVSGPYNKSIELDSQGNIFVSRQVAGTQVTFIDSYKTPSRIPMTTSATQGAVIAKYNEHGQAQWRVVVRGARTDGGYAIDIDKSSGDVILVGYYDLSHGMQVYDKQDVLLTTMTIVPSSSTSIYNLFVLKYSSNGTPVWITRMSNAADVFSYGLHLDRLGNIIITGYYGLYYDAPAIPIIYDSDGSQSAITLPLPQLNSYGDTTRAAFIVKYDTIGTAKWAAVIDSVASETGACVASDIWGNIYVVGRGFQTENVALQTPMNVLNSDGTSSVSIRTPTDTCIFLVKFTGSGIAQWASSIECAYTYQPLLAVDLYGNAYIGGVHESGATIYDADNTVSTGAHFETVAEEAAFIVKYTSSSPLDTYASTVLTQMEQRLGLNTDAPTGSFHMRSPEYAVTLSDTYMTRTIQAAFESYSPMLVNDVKFLQLGRADTARQAAKLSYVHRNDNATASNNILTIGFTSNQEIINATSDGRVGLNTIHPITPLHVVGETTVTIQNNDVYTLCNNYQRLVSQSNQHVLQALTVRSPDNNATFALTHGTLDQQYGGFLKLEGASNKLHIGQIHNYRESNAITVTRTAPVPFVGINTHDPTTSFHVTGNSTFTYSNTTLLAEGSNDGFTLRTKEPLKDLRLLATSNLLIDTTSIGNTRAILSATTGHAGIGIGYEQPQGRLTVRITDDANRSHNTYVYRLSNAPFESYTETPVGSNVTQYFGRSNLLNNAASVRYVHDSPATSAQSNQLQLGFLGAESNHLNLLSMGYAGLGTTAPQAKFHVIGDQAAEYFKATLDGTPARASLTWFQESNTGFYRPAPARVSHTVAGTVISTSSPSNITTHADHTFDQQVRLTIDAADAKTISTLRVTSALHNTDYGPKPTWAASIDGVADDNVQALATDRNGNIYVVGYFTRGGTNLNVYNSNGQLSGIKIRGTTNQSAAFMVKYNKSGFAQWATSIDSDIGSSSIFNTGASIVIDASNEQNIWITGFYGASPIYYDATMTPAPLPLPTGDGNAAYLFKVSSNTGQLISATVIDKLGGDDKGLAVTVDPRHNVYWGGFYAKDGTGQHMNVSSITPNSSTYQTTTYPALLRPATGTSASFLLKLDTTGTIQHAMHIDATTADGLSQITALSVDDEYNLYVAGRYYGQLNVYDASLTGANAPLSPVAPVLRPIGTNNQTTFFIKFSDEGRALWASSIDPTVGSGPTAIRIDNANKKAYLTGFYQSASLVALYESDSQPSSRTQLRATTGSAAYLLKYALPDGRIEWATAVDGASEDYSYSLAVDPFGCSYIAGKYTQFAKVYDASGVESATAPLRTPVETASPIATAYVVKYSPTGTSLWAINIDSTTADAAMGIALDPVTCDLIVCGTTSASPAFYDANNLQANNAPTAITVNVPSAGTASFVARYSSSFYHLLGTIGSGFPLPDQTSNGIQKLLINADTYNRSTYVNVQSGDSNFRTIELLPQSSRRLMWYAGRWRDI